MIWGLVKGIYGFLRVPIRLAAKGARKFNRLVCKAAVEIIKAPFKISEALIARAIKAPPKADTQEWIRKIATKYKSKFFRDSHKEISKYAADVIATKYKRKADGEFRMKSTRKKRIAKTISLPEIQALFPNEQAAIDHVTKVLWTDGAVCPYCNSKRVSTRKRKNYYNCLDCRQDFTIRVGTIFERSHISLHNENANHIVRRYLPKGTDFSKVTRRRIQEIEDEMNGMERAVLGGKSALEAKKEMLNANVA